MRLCRGPGRGGFALILTLILVAFAAIIVIGFLSHATSERASAAAGGDTFRAELAAQNGLEAAKKALAAMSPAPTPGVSGASKSKNDYFIVTASTNASDPKQVPYYFIGTADGGTVNSPTAQYYPLYSGGMAQSGLTVSATPRPSPTPVPTSRAQQTFGATTVYYPRLFSSAPHSTWQQNINTSWQVVDNTIPSTAEHARFTYWIEDLAGYVDANVAGNVDGAGSTHYRPLGNDPKEIALFTLFNNTAQTDPGTTWAATLVAKHPALLTPWSTRVGTTANSTTDQTCLASLVANLSTDSEQSLIPYGLGYSKQGNLKTNINKVISDIQAGNINSDGGVTQIGNTITNNLPSFASTRKGGFSLDYAETLGANIIDYADTDSNPTIGGGYRGIDLYPFVVEFSQEYQWTGPNGADVYQTPNNPTEWYANMTITTFVQVWNMTGTDITSGQLRFVDVNKAGVALEHNGNNNVFSPDGNITSFDRLDTAAGGAPMQAILDFGLSPTPTPNPTPVPTPIPTPGPSATPIIAAGTLHANEYKVFQVAQRTYVLDCGGPTQPGPANSIKLRAGNYGNGNKGNVTQADAASTYQVYWNGVLFDQPPNGYTRSPVTFSRLDLEEYHTTMPGLRYSSANSAPFLLGDPRGNSYIQASQTDITYPNTSWWGRVIMNGNGSYANEARTLYWPDGGHNTSQTGPAPTPAAGSPTPPPTNVGPHAPLEPTKAPARMSNAGQYYSITELSYIYDPFQQDPFTTTPGSAAAVNNGWANAWSNGFNGSSNVKAKYASQSTLRIGRPEFKAFDNNGTRASQFLDILSISDRVSTQGKINLNTASREVLRTLGAGIKIGNLNTNDVDQAIQPSTVYGPKASTEADAFADAVIAARNSSPFISTAQLATLKTGSNPFFGNPVVWSSTDPSKPTEWNDAAAEEYFAKLFNFTTVRSRNFRVFVTGQVYVPANGSQPERVIATANKVYHVFLNPTRNPTTGAITSQNCQVTYAADVY